MSKPARFTQADLKRAVAGVVAAGVPVGRIIINPNGQIEILPAREKPANDAGEWDDLE